MDDMPASPAVFLDRDGTLIDDVGWLARSADLHPIAGAAEALGRLNQSDYKAIVVTNQSVIARGTIDESQLARIHADLADMFAKDGAHWDALYYCPHHPHPDVAHPRAELAIACDCRKPAVGMIEQAAQDQPLDLAKSWLVGDTTTDMMTARRAGLRSILVHTGAAGRDGKWPVLPDFERPTVREATALILDGWPRLLRLIEPFLPVMAPAIVVLVAGLARSGKSTFAAALVASLCAAGKPAVAVPLDSWLKDATARKGAPVLERFDLAAILAFLGDSLATPGRKRIPRYDRRSRRSISDAIEMDIPTAPILVVEGVPALAWPELRALAAHSFFLRRTEPDRLADMTADYRWRGWSDDQITGLLAERASDELPFIEPTSRFADTILENVGDIP